MKKSSGTEILAYVFFAVWVLGTVALIIAVIWTFL